MQMIQIAILWYSRGLGTRAQELTRMINELKCEFDAQ